MATHLASATKQENIASAHSRYFLCQSCRRCLVAVVGNVLVLAAMWRNSSLRTAFYILLAGLAFTDLGTDLVTQPIHIVNELIQLGLIDAKPAMNGIIEKVRNRSNVFFSFTTMLIITLMSDERWLHMTRRSLFSVRRTFIIVAGVTVISITLALYAGQTLTFNFLFLMFCNSITSVAYFKFFRIIWRHQQQIQANESSQNFGQPLIDFTKYKKSVFTILCILFVFYIGYLPMAISLLSNLVLSDREVKRQIFSVTKMLLFWSSSLNPLLYLWRMKDIRDEVKQLFRRLLCKHN